jgi:hypothetical protein
MPQLAPEAGAAKEKAPVDGAKAMDEAGEDQRQPYSLSQPVSPKHEFCRIVAGKEAPIGERYRKGGPIGAKSPCHRLVQDQASFTFDETGRGRALTLIKIGSRRSNFPSVVLRECPKQTRLPQWAAPT